MGTSKSNEPKGEYVGGASIFSGRADPAWALTQELAARLAKLWDSMGPHTGAVPSAPPLGYRGCFLKGPDGREWFAYRGVVTLRTPEGVDSRRDKNREFEWLLLSSAPQETIPRSILDSEFKS
jgi:hypothetical protein